MASWWSSVTGLPDDEEEQDPVSKTLASLGQGLSAAGSAVTGGIEAAGTAVSEAGTTARGWLDDAIQGMPTLAQGLAAPGGGSPVGGGPRPLAPGETGMLEQLPEVGAEYVRAAGETLGDRGAMLAGMRPPETPQDVMAAAAPAPYRLGQIASEVGGEALSAGLGEFAERAAGTEPTFVTNEIATPLGTIPSFEGPTPRQVGETVGRVAGDPFTWVLPGTRADKAADLAIRNLGGAVSSPVRRAVGALGEALEGNAGRVAAADARMAAEGGTALPATFGALPEPSAGGPAGRTVEVLREQLDTATSAWQRAREAGDERMAALAREHAVSIESDLADALNARRSLEPAITSDVGRRVESLPLAEETADTLSGAGSQRADIEGLGGPVSHVPSSINLNAGFGAVPEGGGRRWVPDARYQGGGFWHTPAARVPEELSTAQREVTIRNADHLGAVRAREAAEAALARAPEDVELQHAVMAAIRGEDEAKGSVDAAREWLQMVTTGDKTLATSGAVPTSGGAGALSAVNRALGEGIAGGVGGAVIEQGRNPDEDPRTAAARGFAAGAVGFPVATRLARGAARLAGAAPSPGGGALATFGTPGAGGAPSGLAQRISTAYQQAKADNVARMQAANITPASPLQLAAQVPGAISHAALLGPGTATIGMMSGLIDAAKAPLKEPLRAGVRAVQTGNPSAWREAGETVKGAAAAFYGHEHVGQQLWDLIRGRGRYASSPDRPRLAEQISEPILRQLVGALEVPGRVWSGAPDAIFGTIGRKGAQFREAAQMATDKGLQGTAWEQEVQRVLGDYEQSTRSGTPLTPESARLEGVGARASERAGYQEALGRAGKVGRQIATLGDAPVLGQFVSPYYNTPWNQFIRAGENLPTGALMGRAGDPRLPSSAPGGGGRHAFDRYVDATLGSALVAGAIGYGMQGKITGSGPEDPDERRMLRATGWRPYSYLAGDTYLPNRSAGQYEPILNAIGESADWKTYRKKDADPRMVGEDAFRRIGKLLSESPAASGLKTIMDVVDYGPAALASDVATRLTPGAAAARAVGQAQDPYERTTDRGKGVGFLDEVGQRWQLGTGQRAGLPIQQDPAGRVVPNPRQGLAAFFPQVGTRRDDPLIGAFVEAGISLSGPPPTVEGVQLTPAQRRRYHTMFGEMLEQTAGPLVRSEGWASIPVGTRKTLLEQLSTIARDTAAARTQGEGGEAYWQDYTKAKLEKAGVAP